MQKTSKSKFYNLYSIIAFCLGILSATLFAALFHFFTDFSSNNFIELFSIVINISLGIILYLIIEKKTGDDRTVKNLFHQDLDNIKTDYRSFMIRCNAGKYEAQDINKWFKLMSINITQFETFLRGEFEFSKEECTLQKMNRDIQMAITGSQEFNNNFSKGKVVLSSDTTSKIIELHKYLKHNLFKTAVKISRA